LAPTRYRPTPRRRIFRPRLEGLEDRSVPAVTFSESLVPTPNAFPDNTTVDRDGNMWFTELNVTTPDGHGQIGRITPGGHIDEFSVPSARAGEVRAGPDGNIWFNEYILASGSPQDLKIGVMSTSGVILHEYPLPAGTEPYFTFARDGSLWISEYNNNEVLRMSQDGQIFARYNTQFASTDNTVAPDGTDWFVSVSPIGSSRALGRITPQGTFTAFLYPGAVTDSFRGLAVGPDGNIWAGEVDSGKVAKISPAGDLLAEYASPTPGAAPYTLAVGPDNNIWFTDDHSNQIGQITLQGQVTVFDIPTPNSRPVCITTGLNNTLWFSESYANQVGKITLGQPTTTGLMSSANPSVYGQPVTFTATVSAASGTPTGSVQFQVDGNNLGGPVSLVNGSASLTTATLTAGSHTVTAIYSGDDGFFTSASDPLVETVGKADQHIDANWPVRAPGASSVTLNLTSTSGLPVSYTVSGPATLDPTTDVLTITGLGTVTVTAQQPGDANYNPAPDISTTYAVAPASLCGVLFNDVNGDGFEDYGELGAAGVAVQLTGADFNGAAVSLSATTGASGYYQFPNLLPGTYAVSIPGSLTVTKITVGLNGSDPAVVGSAAGLAVAEGTVENVVNFGLELGALQRGQTAGIGFWQNKNGQALIKSLDGASGTQLGDWLATTFTHLFGASGANLAGQSNAQVAAYFQLLFATRGDKLEAQVLATALSVYVTNSTLAGGTYATAYGFSVAAGGGAGVATVNVGSDGAAVDQANGATMTLMDILLAADRHASHAATPAGFALYAGDQATRGLADDLFGRINDLGGI
jgi:streptogramin lyase